MPNDTLCIQLDMKIEILLCVSHRLLCFFTHNLCYLFGTTCNLLLIMNPSHQCKIALPSMSQSSRQ